MTIVGTMLRSLGHAPSGASAPAAPVLVSVTNVGDGDAVTAAVTGDAGVTIRLYYQKSGAASWTPGASRVGSGTITQTGLDENAWYTFVAVASSGGLYSLPSLALGCYVRSASAEAIAEQILEEVVVTVNSITVANGYNQELRASRPTRLDLDKEAPADNGTVVVMCGDPEPDPEHSNAGYPQRQAWLLTLVLLAYVIPSDSDKTPIDTLISRVRADIEKALQVDPTRGGLAIWTRPAGSQKFIQEGAAGVAVLAEVLYRTPINDPYTNAG